MALLLPAEAPPEGDPRDGTPPIDTREQQISQPSLQYIRPSDGKLTPLVLQSFEDPEFFPPTQQWVRLGRPPYLASQIHQLSYWVAASLRDGEGSQGRAFAIAITLAKYIVALPLLTILGQKITYSSMIANRRPITVLKDNRYDAILSHGGYRSPANTDTFSQQPQANSLTLTDDPGLKSRPKYLCYVRDYETESYDTINVAEYVRDHGGEVDLEFIFVSYSRTQFLVGPEHQENEVNGRRLLIRWAIHAAKQAQKKAFWIDFECIRESDGTSQARSMSYDVYRICDIVRAAHSMIIAIGPPLSSSEPEVPKNGASSRTARDVTAWLRLWGSRLWTLPELLLSPEEHRIKLYIAGDTTDPISMAKRNFAERAWDDADEVKELVDHFEGSAVLSRLQLIEAALTCFSRRTTASFSRGDVAYAIMGLLPLSQRPAVHKTDTAFQAFARLSLASHNDRFFERLLCLESFGSQGNYHDIKDFWGAKLSDMTPETEVVTVLEKDTIELAGARGATIHWDCLKALDNISRATDRSNVVSTIFQYCALFMSLAPKISLLMALMYYMVDPQGQTRYFIQFHTWFMIAAALVFGCIAPALLYWTRSRRKAIDKATLVGLEGHMDSATLERYLWGFSCGRLKQVPGHAPVSVDNDQRGHEMGSYTAHGHAFTLFDAKMQTVMHIRATRPPAAMLVLGHAGGIYRAMLCSYEWQDDVYVKESMVTLSNGVVEDMKSVNRFRLRLGAVPDPQTDGQVVKSRTRRRVDTSNGDKSKEDTTETTTEWKTELVYMTALLGAFIVHPIPQAWLRNVQYCTAFALAQMIAYPLYRYVSPSRVFPHLCNLKAYAMLLYFVFKNPYGGLYLQSMLQGLIDGLLLVVLIATLWSWHSKKSLASRTLGLVLFWHHSSQVFLSIPNLLFYRWLLFVMAIFYLVLGFGNFISSPMEAAWLGGFERARLTSRAAAGKYTKTTLPRWALKKSLSLLTDARPFIALGVSICTSLISKGRLQRVTMTSELCALALSLSIVALVRYLPASQIPLMFIATTICAVVPMTPKLNSPALYPLNYLLLSPQYILDPPSSWPRGLQALVFAMFGTISGRVISISFDVFAHWWIVLTILSVDSIFLFLLWRFKEGAGRHNSNAAVVPDLHV